MEQRNLVFAVIASIVILIGFQYFYELPRQRAHQAELERQAVLTQQQVATTAPSGGGTLPAPGASPAAPAATAPAAPADRATVIARGPRLTIASPRLAGSISLVGGRIDDLTLVDYHETTDRRSPNIVLLSPPGSHDAYYVDYGWVSTDPSVKLPGPDTAWQPSGGTLTATQSVTLTWDNGQGLKFTRTFAVDDNFMFTVRQKVENAGDKAVTLFPYARVLRSGMPKTSGYYILHEGPLAVIDGHLVDSVGYKDVVKAGAIDYDSTGGWIGITDKYWLVSLIPDQKDAVKARFAHELQQGTDLFQADFREAGGAQLAPGGSVETGSRLFAGAKEVRLLDRYRDELGIPLFDRAVDFGWFYFLTKPIFFLLDYLNGVVRNFGIAILLLTVAIKLLFLPLANRSYRAMSKMKALAPEMTKLRERYKDDKAKLNSEMMALYKREKVNPAAGCLPILIQIPVFFSLYKVLFVTIEMRHAPFFGWIKDLSSPDPTSILNLFGVLPWAVPDLSAFGPLHLISIGVWPIIMGITMFLQQKLNPAPPDPVQARIFMLLPVIFTFMLGQFAAGLVIYWAWNNLLSIAQQRFIMWRMGVKA
jgi:YidC/Oxa1 family membrane protein insertase